MRAGPVRIRQVDSGSASRGLAALELRAIGRHGSPGRDERLVTGA